MAPGPGTVDVSATLTDLLARHVPAVKPGSIEERRSVIPIDIKVDDSEVVVLADLPGIDEDEIDIQMVGDVLSISGERSFDHDKEDAEEYVRLERPYGPFERHVRLPSGLNACGITAKYKRGVLKVRVPKGGAKG